jgi:uncharacterized protein (TIGR03067 family)
MKRLLGALLLAGALPAAAADPKDDAIKEELKKLEGTWTPVSIENDGQKADPEQVKKLKLVIKDGKWTVYINDKVSTRATFTIDPTKKHKTLDMTGTMGGDKGQKYLAIYQLDGDNLKVCIGDTKTRPKAYDAKTGSRHQLEVWKRVKE